MTSFVKYLVTACTPMALLVIRMSKVEVGHINLISQGF